MDKRGPTTVKVSRAVGAALRSLAAERGAPTIDVLLVGLLQEFADRSTPMIDLPRLTDRHGYQSDRWERALEHRDLIDLAGGLGQRLGREL